MAATNEFGPFDLVGTKEARIGRHATAGAGQRLVVGEDGRTYAQRQQRKVTSVDLAEGGSGHLRNLRANVPWYGQPVR